MQTLETIYAFRTRNFCVKVETLPEHDPDLSFDESGETAEMIERGDWLCFSVRASLSFRDSDIAEDFLGDCIYQNFHDFRDNVGNKNSYFSYMVRQVIKEGREQMKNIPTLRQ